MEDVPVDAQRVVEELRALRHAQGALPRTWSPSEVFDALLVDATQPPVQSNDHLEWMHRNWDLSPLLAPPPGKGVKGLVKRLQHRLVMAVLAPYFARLQEYLGVNVRAVDAVSKRATELSVTEMRTITALRHDLIDFAHAVDRRLDG